MSDKQEIIDTKTWVSHTKTGKGFIIVLDEDVKAGDCLTGSIVGLENFVSGNYKGLNLGKLRDKRV